MLESLTIKFPSSLMKTLREKSCAQKMSQGAYVREALVHYLDCASEEKDSFDFLKVTQNMLKGRKRKKSKKVSNDKPSIIDEIRAFYKKHPPQLSAEEEVRRSRTRGML